MLLFLPRLKAFRVNSVESTEGFHRAFANGDTGMHGLGQRPVLHHRWGLRLDDGLFGS